MKITGPSGCGKSTSRPPAWPEAIGTVKVWPADTSVIDGFPAEMSVKESRRAIIRSDSAARRRGCGRSTFFPPAKFFRARSPGFWPKAATHRFSTNSRPSSMHRRQMGSAAIAKGSAPACFGSSPFSCYEDVIDLLQPIGCTPRREFVRMEVAQRWPDVAFENVRTTAAAWPLFAPRHYLSHALNTSARLLLATVALPGHDPASAPVQRLLPFLGKGPPARRE